MAAGGGASCWGPSPSRGGRSARGWRFRPPTWRGGRVALASLRSARLVRCIGQANDDVETYHDRIRETVVAHLPPEELRWHHDRLAQVLETAGPVDPEVLADHYRGAGDTARACEYYARGADQAAATLAFDHAATLYKVALDLHSGTALEARELGKKLGDALANAGRGADAATAYLTAALAATGPLVLDLKRLASTQLLISGHIDEGLALCAPSWAHSASGCPRGPVRPGSPCAGIVCCFGPAACASGPRLQPDLPRGARAYRLSLVGRCRTIDDRADPRRRLSNPRTAARAQGWRAFSHRPGPGHGGRAHGGGRHSGRTARCPVDLRRRRDGPIDRLPVRSRHDRHGQGRQGALVRRVEARPCRPRRRRADLPQPMHRRHLGT